MRFYLDILKEKVRMIERDKELYHYHVWSLESIQKFWQIATASIIVEQFYPEEYWQDLIKWAYSIIRKDKEHRIKRICDIGCGNGNLIKVLSEKFPTAEILGIDLTEDSLRFAKNRFSNNKLIDFKVGSITSIPVEDNSLDLITVTEVLEHLFLNDFINGFNEISKKLKRGGYLLATVPFGEKFTLVGCPECGCIFHPH